MISLVERGESSPTAVVLEKIASGLGVSLAALFDDSSAAANPMSRRDDRTPWRDPQSGYVRRNISPTYRLSEDDCLAMQLNESTAFRNRTRKPSRYIVIVATERSHASRRRK
jgi:transcriptional regulator with XRE-family HTH domain